MVIVELVEMPTLAEWLRFIESLGPGQHEVVIKTPDGSFTTKGSIGIADQPTVRMMLRGARVYLPADEVDARALVGDMAL